MDKPGIIRKGIMTLLTVLVIAYVIYVICRASFTQVKTITAKETEVYNSISTQCYVIKDEEFINYDGSGVISYTVGDGEKVSVNQTVAGIFDSVSTAGNELEIRRLDAQIEALERLGTNADTISQTPDEIDKSINGGLIRASMALNSGDLELVNESADDVLYYINERQLVTGRSKDYSDRIKSLESKRDQLKKTSQKSKKYADVKSKVAGYFVGSIDGYENLVPTSKLEEIMPADFTEEKLKPKKISNNVIGKTVTGVTWYVACKVSAQDTLKIKNARSLKLDIPVVSNEKINVELYSINQKSKSDDAVIILSGTFMNSEMAAIRKGEFSIILQTYNGIYVPKSAVHDCELKRTAEDKNGKKTVEKKTVPGVYVKIGNEVTFKQINILFSGDDYVISDADKNAPVFSPEAGILQAYDEIITEGANLYDGKIISRDA